MWKRSRIETARSVGEALKRGDGIALWDPPSDNRLRVRIDPMSGDLTISGDVNMFCVVSPVPYASLTLPKIERVIFNPPATIVFWDDKTKTVVKCSECEASPRPDCAMKIHYGACFRESDMRFLLPYMDAQAEEEWKLRGIIAAMLKKAWGNVAPSMIAEALAAADWNGGADD